MNANGKILIFGACAVALLILKGVTRSSQKASTNTGYGSPYLPETEALPGGAAAWFEYKPFSLARLQ